MNATQTHAKGLRHQCQRHQGNREYRRRRIFCNLPSSVSYIYILILKLIIYWPSNCIQFKDSNLFTCWQQICPIFLFSKCSSVDSVLTVPPENYIVSCLKEPLHILKQILETRKWSAVGSSYCQTDGLKFHTSGETPLSIEQ